MMTKWISVNVSDFANDPACNSGTIFYEDSVTGLKLHLHVSQEEGKEVLKQAEKLLNKQAEFNINQFNPSITYYEINGFIDWD